MNSAKDTLWLITTHKCPATLRYPLWVSGRAGSAAQNVLRGGPGGEQSRSFGPPIPREGLEITGISDSRELADMWTQDSTLGSCPRVQVLP